MYLNGSRNVHLSYCTNIHPSKNWDNAFDNVKSYTTELKKRLSPDQKFGIGLSLSNAEMTELSKPEVMQAFRDYLDENGLYVFTINGFVYGEFHNPRIKDTIHSPDWRTEERLNFSLGLVDVMANLLPDYLDEGSFSTQPLSYKLWDDVDPSDDELWRAVTRNIVLVAAKMVEVREATGKFIHVDIEPEPDCLLENSDEVVEFYEKWLLAYGAELLAEQLDIDIEEAKTHLLDHIQICYDTCHISVAFEDAKTVLDKFEAVGIKVGKVQISSALKVPLKEHPAQRGEQAEWLDQFAETNFLHQVSQRNKDGSIKQYGDLDKALPHIGDDNAEEWRIHFHVPIFVESYHEETSTTQDAIIDALDEFKKRHYTNFMEIETYTWEVLPEDKRVELTDSIEREFRWTLECLS